jgi:hypothetical protein
MTETQKAEDNVSASISTGAETSRSNKKSPQQSETQKNLKLIHNWYQSYYMWSITCSHLALNSQFNTVNTGFMSRKFISK